MGSFNYVNTGNVANNQLGDPLRNAFQIINLNFANIAAGNANITVNAPVLSVAGRTGNVLLGVSDIAGAVGVSRVNLLDANLGVAITNITTLQSTASTQATQINLLNANVTAANLAIAGIVAGSGYATIAQLTANVTVANANAALQSSNITSLFANAAVQDANLGTATTNITALQSNAATQATLITTVNANVTAANARITTLDANLGTATTNITTLQSNAAAQATQINLLNANVTSANATIAFQTIEINYIVANATAANAAISAINSNLGTTSTNIISLQSNAITQATQINSLNANITAANILLLSNAGVQATAINSINANVTSANVQIQTNTSNVLALQANATAQDSQIRLLNANVTASNVTLATLVSNAATQGTSLNRIDSNLGVATTNITSLQANLLAANSAISTKATIVAPTFTGNVNSTGNVYAAGYFYSNGAPFLNDALLVTTANTNMNTYVNDQVVILGARINASNGTSVAGNVNMKRYVDGNVAILLASIASTNANITAANLAANTGSTFGSIRSNVIPGVDNFFTIGKANQQWKSLYLSGNANIGGNVYAPNVSVAQGEFVTIYTNSLLSYGMITAPNLTIANSGPIIAGNITAGNIFLSANVYFNDGTKLTSADYQQTNTYFVDPARTDVYTQVGTINRPFKTITAANAAAYTSGHNDSNPAYIVLMGSITENVTLTQGGIFLTSAFASGTHSAVNLTGNITINAGTGTLSDNHFSISNMRIIAGTNGKGVNFTGTNPQRLFMRDLWIDANGTGSCVYADNTGTGSTVHMNTGHLTHSAPAGNDVYCFDARKGTMTLTDIETSGNVQVGRTATGATMTVDSSEIDAINGAAFEMYGGNLIVTRSTITNTYQYGNGINLLGSGSILTVGDCLFNISGASANVRAVYNYLASVSSLNAMYYQYLAFFPGSNNKITANLANTALTTTMVSTV